MTLSYLKTFALSNELQLATLSKHEDYVLLWISLSAVVFYILDGRHQLIKKQLKLLHWMDSLFAF